MQKYSEILEKIGLTPNEAKIYYALLELKKGTIWDISAHADIHRRNSYDTIQRLMEKGLAYQVLDDKVLTYAPVRPDKLTEMVSEKMEALTEALPGLQARYEKLHIPQSMYVYKGVGGLRNFISLILEVGKDIYGIGSKGTWFDPRLGRFITQAVKKLEQKKIKNHLIFDESLRRSTEVLKAVGKPYKFLPSKYASGSSVDIFGDYVAIYSGVNVKNLDEDITIFIIRDKTMARDYRKWFDFMWDMLPAEK